MLLSTRCSFASRRAVAERLRKRKGCGHDLALTLPGCLNALARSHIAGGELDDASGVQHEPAAYSISS
jgi:hypothetical protein